MQKNTFWHDIYTGRKINWETFKKYFEMNGSDDTCYIYYVENENGPEFRLYAYINGDTVVSAHAFKADVYGGHGRPIIDEKNLTASEKKYAIEIYDQCFIDRVGEELESIIENAVSKNLEYGGYTAIKQGKDYLLFITEDGKKVKLQNKHLLQALDYSHLDLKVLRDENTMQDLAKCLGIKFYEPLAAILQEVDPSGYPEYAKLEGKYRYEKMEDAVKCGTIEACEKYVDVLKDEQNNVESFCEIAISNDNEELLKWLIANTDGAKCDLCVVMGKAIAKDKEELFYYFLNSGMYDAGDSNSEKWESPMNVAVRKGNKKYIKAMLEKGFSLSPKTASNMYAAYDMDEIVRLLPYKVKFDDKTIKRIYDKGRTDIILALEEWPLRYCDEEQLFKTYIYCGNYEKFAGMLEAGYQMESKEMVELFEAAYANSPIWTDLWIRHGFNIKYNNSELLHRACYKLNADYMIYLIENGADMHAVQYSSTIFEKVASYDTFRNEEKIREKEKLCRYFLEKGLNPIKESSNSKRIIYYLLKCSEEFALYVIDWLAAHECINSPDYDAIDFCDRHLPVSYILSRYDYRESLLRYFIKKGVCMDAQGITRDKLFVKACEVCDLDALKVVVDAGANVQEESSTYGNGLFSAVMFKRSIEIIKYLVGLEIDINYIRQGQSYPINSIRDVPSESVLDIAERVGYTEAAEYLKALGALHAEELIMIKVADESLGEVSYHITDGVLIQCSVKGQYKVILPEGISRIREKAFFHSRVEAVTVAEGVTTIEKNAFFACDYLKKIYISSTVAEFTVSGLLVSNLPELREFIVSSNNKMFSSNDGVLFNKEQTELIKCPANYAKKIYVVPDSVTRILGDAFRGCYNIEEIILPKHQIEFDARCFAGFKSIKKICFHETLEKIPAGMFLESGIEEISLPAGVKVIGATAFRYSKLKKIVLSPVIESIGNYAFSPSSLTEFVIPATITHKVEENAFSSCCVKFAVKFPENSYVDFEHDHEYMESFLEFYLQQSNQQSDELYIKAVEEKKVLKRHLIHVAITRLFIQNADLDEDSSEFYKSIIRSNRKQVIVSLIREKNKEFLRLLLENKYVTRKGIKSAVESGKYLGDLTFIKDILEEK